MKKKKPIITKESGFPLVTLQIRSPKACSLVFKQKQISNTWEQML